MTGHLLGAARLLLMVAACVCLGGCSRRDGLNFECEWVADPKFEVNPSRSPDMRHLLDDIRAAEELAIRYGDRVAGWRLVDAFGIVSRHGGLKNRDAGRLAHQECLARLINTIASTHQLAAADIDGVRPRLRERGFDPMVTVPVALLFVIALRRFTRWLRDRFDPGEWAAWIIATMIGSVVLTFVVVAIGAAWGMFVEIARVGNEHLSYRAQAPDRYVNLLVMFGIGTAVTWIASAIAAVRVSRRRVIGIAL